MLKNNIELDVKVKCIEKNITQVQIAKTIGTTAPYVCRILKAGDKVKTGQALGTVDTIAGESQLHFQIWKGTTPQNPELWLR